MKPPFTVQPGAAGIPTDWDAVESWLGLRLPTDYRALASEYGPLDVGEYLWLHVPCVQAGRFDYGVWLKDTHRRCRSAARKLPPYAPLLFHPEPGGLLAFGETRSADCVFWDTSASDEPDRWPVVVYVQDEVNAGQNPWRHLGLTLTELLDSLFRTGVPLTDARTLGPFPARARRTAFLSTPTAWAPPAPDPPEDSVRRTALTEGSGLDALRRLVPPPARPYLGLGDWDELFDALGTRLPREYVDLMEIYGGGAWSSWLNFITPLRREATQGYQGLADFVEQILDGYRSLRADHPQYQPLAVWPEPGGFLPFADSIDGDVLGWLTLGEPDDWPLIVYPRHEEQGPPLPGRLVDTLLDCLRGRPIPGFANLDEDEDPLDHCTFEQWNATTYH